MISIPIVSEFDGKGVKKALEEFKQLEGAGAKAQFAIKKAAIPAAAAVAGLTVALGDAVKAAMDDEKSQQLLARQLKATTGATDAQIAATEEWISAQGKLLGVADDQLRPTLAGLTRVTKNVQEAQGAATLAMDIAAAKGVSLETVSKSLEKAYGGNIAALAKLDPSVRDMIKGGASLEEVFAKLSETYGGAAKAASNTAAGGFAKLKLSLDETKESIGAALLPVIQKVLPYLQKAADWAQENPKAFTIIAGAIGAVATAILAVNAAMALNPFGLIAVGIAALVTGITIAYTKFEGFRNVVNSVVNGIASAFEFMANSFISAINIVIRGINLVKPGKDIPSLSAISIGRIGEGSSSPASAGNFRMAESALSATGAGAGDVTAGLGAGYAVQAAKKVTGTAGALSDIYALTGNYDTLQTGGLPSINMSNFDASTVVDSLRQSGADITINVNGGDPNAVVDALRRYMLQNGTVPIRVAA